MFAHIGTGGSRYKIGRDYEELRRMHWSKEASRFSFTTPNRITPRIKLICHRIIATVMEAIIR